MRVRTDLISVLIPLLGILFFAPVGMELRAQPDPVQEEDADPEPTIDTASNQGRPLTDSINQSAAFVMTKDPVKAVLWGLIPGGGQVYTEQYWKVPVFVIPMAVFTGLAVHFEGKRAEYAQQAIDLEEEGGDNRAAVSNRNSNQDRRDLNIAITGGVFLLSLVDAYVGAHLYDFDVGDSLASIRFRPAPEGLGIGMTVSW